MKIIYSIVVLILLSNVSFGQCEDFEVEITYTNPLCPDYADGSVSTSFAGGTPPFEIQITNSDGVICNTDGGSETGFLLLEGWYFVNVVDDEGCVFEDSVLLVDPLQINVDDYTIIEPSDLEICDGSISIDEVSGDFEDLYYSWSPDPDGISGLGANVMTDACPGTYNLAITNEIGCSESYEFELGEDLSIEKVLLNEIQVINLNHGFNVKIEHEFNSNLSVHITNLNGQNILVRQIDKGNNLIDFRLHGTFILSIVDEAGKLIFAKKIVR